MSGRVVLLLTTPRVAPGLLSRAAWQVLEHADGRFAAEPEEDPARGIQDAGMPVARLPGSSPARRLVELATQAGQPGQPGRQVVWVVGADGDPGLTDAVAAEVTRVPDPPEVEVLVGCHDLPGARLLDLVHVMDRLRSPGGCPWDAEQTPRSLVPYLLEEAHEAIEAIESGDPAHVCEELGDVLLQVAFQARVAAEDPAAPFDIDDVAAGIVAKLVRRHPHVFAGPGEAAAGDGVDHQDRTAADVAEGWERLKAAEKSERTSVLDGVPAGLPALARADTILGRLDRAGRRDLVADLLGGPGDDGAVGAALLTLVDRARASSVDAEAALRGVLREVERRAAGSVSVLRGP